MKHLILLIFVLFLARPSYAQPDEKRSFLALGAGIAIPSGSFASTSPDKAEAGYARTGFSTSFTAGSLLTDWFGVTGMIGYHSLPFDEGALVKNYLATHPGYDFEMDSDPYSMLNLAAGPGISIPQGRIDLGARVLIGMAVCRLPGSSYTTHSGMPGDPFYLVQSMPARSTSLVYGGGLNLMFRIKKGLGILIDAFYMQANADFNAVEVRVYEYGKLTGLTGVDIEQTYSFFGLNAGLAFTF